MINTPGLSLIRYLLREAPKVRLRLTVLLLLLLLFEQYSAAQSQITCTPAAKCNPIKVSFKTCADVGSVFCENESICFEVDGDSSTYDLIIFDWGDMSKPDTLIGTRQIYHTFSFPDTFCLENLDKNQEVRMIAEKRCPNGVSRRCITEIIRLRLNPFARFSIPYQICVGSIMEPFNNTCENDDSISYKWSLNDQLISLNETPEIPFPVLGQQKITLFARNSCGSHTTSRFVDVVWYAEPKIDLDYRADSCVIAELDMFNLSAKAQRVEWSVFPGSGYTLLDSTMRNDDTLSIRFDQPGTYTVQLKAYNVCGDTTLKIPLKIIDKPQVQLKEIDHGCGELFLNPEVNYEGFIDHITWKHSGDTNWVSNEIYPYNIYFLPGQYRLDVIVNNYCGADTATQNFIVDQRPGISFIHSGAQMICQSHEPFKISAEPPGGKFSGDAMDRQGFFIPAKAKIGRNVVYYETNQGCLSRDSLVFTVIDGADLALPDSIMVCANQNSIRLDFTPQGGLWHGPGIIDSARGLFDPGKVTIGPSKLTYSYFDPVAGCLAEQSMNLIVIAPPEIDLDPVLPVCNTTEAIDLQESITRVSPLGGVFNWKGQGIIDTFTGLFFAPGGYEKYVIEVNYDLSSGCSAKDSFIIQVQEFEKVKPFAPVVVCDSYTTIKLTGEPSGGYWTGAGIDPNTGLVNLRQPARDSVFNYAIYAGTTCESKEKAVIRVVPGTPIELGPDIYVCETTPTIRLPDPKVSGTWSGPPFNHPDSIRTADLNTQNVFRFTVDNLPVGCNSDSIRIIVGKLPEIFIQTDSIVCVNSDLTIKNLTTGAQTYEWIFGNQNSVMTTPLFKGQLPGLNHLVLKASSLVPNSFQKLCTTIDSLPIEILESPQNVDFELSDREICGPAVIGYTNTSEGSYLQYEWLLGNGASPDHSMTPEPQVYISGHEDTTYVVLLKGWNLCGSLQKSDSVKILASPQADFGINFARPCSGDSLLLNNRSSGSPDAFTWHVESIGEFQQTNPPVLFPQTDTIPKDIMISLYAQNQCATDTLVKTLVIQPKNTRALFLPSVREICALDTLIMINQSTQNARIYWKLNDGTAYLGDTVRHAFTQAGNYEVTIYAYDCGVDSMTQKIEVHPVPDIQLVQPGRACEEEIVIFSIETDGVVSAITFEDGFVSQNNYTERKFSNSGIYRLKATAWSPRQCGRTLDDQILIEENPEFESVIKPGCTDLTGSSLEINTDQMNLVEVYGEKYSGKGHVHHGLQTGTYQVLITAPTGCYRLDSAYVPPINELQIMSSDSVTIEQGATTQLEVFANQRGVDYVWIPQEGLSDAGVSNPLATPYVNTNYIIKVSNTQGCTVYDTVYVSVLIDREKGIYIPNAFTPDGSGYNDIFYLRSSSLSLKKIKEFRIYDQWGELVHLQQNCLPEDMTCAWDGQFRGQKAVPGVYLYLIKLEYVDGSEREVKGDITLIR